MASEKLYKTIDSDILKKISLKCERKYYYLNENDEKVSLKESRVDELSNNQIFKLDDEKREWSELRKRQSLFLDLHITMSEVYSLFYSESKICQTNAELGLGLEWKSKESKVKFCKKLTTINKFTENIDINILDLEIKNPDSDIDFRWFIYISKAGKAEDSSEEKFAKSEGLVLGKEHWWTIMVSGNGSIFPVDENAKPGNPLWTVRANFSDWAQDEFSIDNVAVTFNPAHPLYEKINYGGDEFDEQIFKEVISSALSTLITEIILQAKENGDFDLLNKEPTEEAGSILAAVRYFKEANDFKLDSLPSELYKSVKLFFEEKKL